MVDSPALQSLMGADATNVAIESKKSMIGHLLKTSGTVESIVSILAIRAQVAPPTITLEKPSQGCELNYILSTPQN